MAKTSYSDEMVRGNRKAVLTIPGAVIKDSGMGYGMTTGRDTNKIEKLGIGMQDIPGSGIQIPEHTLVVIQCTLKESLEVGDHYPYICDVDRVFADENEEAFFAWNVYSKIAAVKQGE